MTFPNLYHLKYFVDAVELGSLSSSARVNQVSHVAVSQGIKTLESQLGVKLLHHQQKAFQVTQSGFAFALRAQQLLAQVLELHESPAEQAIKISGTVTVGMSRTIARAYLSALLTKLEKLYPEIQLKLRFGTVNDMMERTLQGQVDLSLTIGFQSLPTLTQSLVKEGEYILIESKRSKANHRFDRGFVITKAQYETEILKKSFVQEFQKSFPLKLEVGSWDVISELVAQNQGVGLVPDISLSSERTSSIRRVSAPWFQCGYQIYLNQRRRQKQGLIQSVVSDVIKDLLKS